MTNMESRQNGSIENIKRQIAITLRTGHTRNRGIGDHLFCLPQAIIEQLKVVQNSGNLNKLGSEYGKYEMLMKGLSKHIGIEDFSADLKLPRQSMHAVENLCCLHMPS